MGATKDQRGRSRPVGIKFGKCIVVTTASNRRESKTIWEGLGRQKTDEQAGEVELLMRICCPVKVATELFSYIKSKNGGSLFLYFFCL